MIKRGGSSLASTLLLISICVGLAFTMVGLAFHHLNVGNRLSNSQQAKNFAESAVSLAMEKVLKADGDYPKPGKHTVVVHFPNANQESFGVCSFNATVAGTYGMDMSTNNLKKDAAITNLQGRLVPKESVHFVGLGSCGGVEKRIEAILQVPIFQSAISAEAPIECTGPMLVASADSSADDTLLTNPENFLSKLMPAHVTTNRAATLGQDVLITGFCQAAGAVNTSGNATVKGGIRANGGKSEVPQLDVNDFDPAKLGRTHALENPSLGVYRADGGLIKMNNDVVGSELILPDGVSKSGAIVFVDGNIKVKEIRGVGAVIATGNITVTNSTNLSSDGTLAMLAAGNLSLVGEKENADAIVKGIAYAGKSLTIDNVTLVGTMVQAGSGAGDALKVERANFIKTNDTVEFEFDMPFGIDASQGGVRMIQDPQHPLTSYYDAVNDRYDPGLFDNSHLIFVDASGNPVTDLETAGSMVKTAWPGGPDPFTQTWAEVFAADPAYYNGSTENINIAKYMPARFGPGTRQDIADIEAFYEKFKLQPKKKGKISFNPSRFLTLTQAVRIILWKDL